MTVADLLVDGLACYRLTRLVTTDRVTRDVRGRVIQAAYASAGRCTNGDCDDVTLAEWAAPVEDANAPLLAALLTCDWCVSMWCAIGVDVARRKFPAAWPVVARALALSSLTGLVSSLPHS